jgi:hypothetical protein
VHNTYFTNNNNNNNIDDDDDDDGDDGIILFLNINMEQKVEGVFEIDHARRITGSYGDGISQRVRVDRVGYEWKQGLHV